MSDQSIFLNALERTAAEREEYLAQVCAGNEPLRREIEGLLAAHERGGTFLDDPAMEQIARQVPADEQNTLSVALTPNLGPNDATSIDANSATEQDETLSFLQPPTRPGSIGRLAHYEIQERVGSGGFGTVLKAFDDRLHRVVAIKVMAIQLASSGTARKRFIREARSAAAVRNDHIVSIHAIEEGNLPYLVMEFVAGQTLQQKLDSTGPLDVKAILRIGHQIAVGLSAAHATGLIHRDIKPANVLLENGVERVKITDFGLARTADDASISQSGVVAGTPTYMAPEQARGEHIDHRADLFSLGSVMYAMCAGHPPFRASTILAVLKRVVDEEPRSIREINSEIPQWLCDVVSKLHAKDPNDRFANAKEVADLLAKYLVELQTQGVVTPVYISQAERPRSSVKVEIAHPAPKRSAWPKRIIWGMTTAFVVVLGLILATSPKARSPIDRLLGYGTVVVYLDDPNVTLTSTHDPDRLVSGVGYHNLRLKEGTYEFTAATQDGRSKTWSVEVRPGMYEPLGVRTAELQPTLVAGLPNADGWIQLFNGKDTTGWKTHPDQPGEWKVENDVLVGRGGENPTILFSERGDFENFHFLVEAKINDVGDSGQLFRSEYGFIGQSFGPESPYKSPKSYEANISFLQEQKIGTLWGASWPPVGPTESLIAPDTWFTQEVIARGNRLVIKVNGKTTVDFTDPLSRYRRGHLALQANVKGTVVQFKRIEIKELPPAGASGKFALAFDGKGQVDIPTLSLDRLGPVTLEGYVKPEQFDHLAHVFGASNHGIHAWKDWRFGWMIDVAEHYIWKEPSQGIVPNRRVHVAGVFANGQLRLFVDGRLQVEKTEKAPSKGGVLTNVYLGGKFQGQMQEVRISRVSRYVKDFTPEPSFEPDDDTLALYHFEEGAGDILKDSSGNNHHGKIVNAKWVNADGPIRAEPATDSILRDSVLLLNFEKDSFYQKDGKTWVRDMSGKGNDGLCEGVEFAKDGQAGGSLQCKGGRLWIPKSFLNRRSDFTIACWIKNEVKAPQDFSIMADGGNPPNGQGGAYLSTNRIYVNAWNKQVPQNWTTFHAGLANPESSWEFVAIRLRGGDTQAGEVVVTRGSKSVQGKLRMQDADSKDETIIGFKAVGFIDELVVLPHFLTDAEVQSLQEWGKNERVLQLEASTPPLAIAPFDATKAKEHQKNWAKHLGVDVEMTNSIGMKLRLIPPGEFNMGTPEAIRTKLLKELKDTNGLPIAMQYLENEPRLKSVRILEPFYAGVYEVTVGQFRSFIEASGHKTDGERSGLGGWGDSDGKWQRKPEHVWTSPGPWKPSDALPVVQISYNDAKAFCDWLSKQEGRQYIVPDEAHWEYSARAGTTGSYGSNEDSRDLPASAWFQDNLPNPEGRQPQIGGGRRPNAFGLHDMLGNVWEWCSDIPAHAPKQRILRGGSWYCPDMVVRVNSRGGAQPDEGWDAGTGFRVMEVNIKVKSPPPAAVAPFDAKQAKAHQDAWAKHLGVETEITNSIGMKLRLIPPGEFTRGLTKEQVELALVRAEQEWERTLIQKSAARPARVPEPFYIGAYEVTRGEFRQFVKATGYRTTAERNGKGGHAFDGTGKKHTHELEYIWSFGMGKTATDDDPVEFVTPEDADAFCAWLGTLDGRRYALVSEDQWEFACRGGTTTLWWTGDNPIVLHKHERLKVVSPKASGGSSPNPFGLHDMHGNLMEWVRTSDGIGQRSGTTGNPVHWTCSGLARAVPGDPDKLAQGRCGFRVALVGNLKTSPADLRREAVLVMNFDKDTFYEKDGQTWVRDLSGQGNDGLCEGVVPTDAGRVGGGLSNDGKGFLRIPKQLLRSQGQLTWAGWYRFKAMSDVHMIATQNARYPGVNTPSFLFYVSADGKVHTNVFSGGGWHNQATPTKMVEPGIWTFVAFRFQADDKGMTSVRVWVNDKTHDFSSRAIGGGASQEIVASGLNGTADEIALWHRALSDAEVRAVYELGQRGESLGDGPSTPPPAVAPFDAKQAKAHQDAWAKHLGIEPEITNAIGMKLRVIPPGEFTMGTNVKEIDWLLANAPDLKDSEDWLKDIVRNEGPDRRVTVREPFLLGTHEVTVGEFREFVKATKYKTEAETNGGGKVWNNTLKDWERNPENVWSSPKHSRGESHPVVFITLADARAFCDWLSEKDGRKYSVPSEEQWEYACRAGTTTRWFFGDDANRMNEYAWIVGNSAGIHKPIARKLANPFGLFDMYGNAAELTISPQNKIIERGGKASEAAERARSAWRFPVKTASEAHANGGFRVAVAGDFKARDSEKGPAPREVRPMK